MSFFTGYHKKSVFIRIVCVVDRSINPNSILAEDLNNLAQQHKIGGAESTCIDTTYWKLFSVRLI